MDSSTKRKVGAIALIAAGIGAFLVPFLLHGPALQASSNNGGNSNNNNNGGGTTSGSSNNNRNNGGNGNGGGSGGGTTCSADPSSHENEGKHLAKGHDKQDKDAASALVAKAHGFMATLHKHNPQHDATHSTKTDNDTVGSHSAHSHGHDSDNGDCAANNENDDSDDQGEDD